MCVAIVLGSSSIPALRVAAIIGARGATLLHTSVAIASTLQRLESKHWHGTRAADHCYARRAPHVRLRSMATSISALAASVTAHGNTLPGHGVIIVPSHACLHNTVRDWTVPLTRTHRESRRSTAATACASSSAPAVASRTTCSAVLAPAGGAAGRDRVLATSLSPSSRAA